MVSGANGVLRALRGAVIVMSAVAAVLASPGQPAVAIPLPTDDVVATGYVTTATTPRWQQRLDRMLAGKSVGVSVRLNGARLYTNRAKADRIPASNQKLLMTMALFHNVDPASRLRTAVVATHRTTTTVKGDLWLVGGGDPSVTSGGRFARSLPYRPTRLARLARRIRDAGITRITGSIKGDSSAFSRDWWARGWRSQYPERYAPLPSALSLNGNVVEGRHIANPEVRAAGALTRKLRALGVRVRGEPARGVAPSTAKSVAAVRSDRLVRIMRYMNRRSSNFHAEVLGKYLAKVKGRRPVTIGEGATAVRRWASARNVSITAHDASGLSWKNRASANDIARLLDGSSAASAVRSTLAKPGTGTLDRRLGGVRVAAKTGTLPGHSALSGYVYLQRRGRWASFSILCEGMSKSAAVALEDNVVELLEERAR